NTTSPVFWIVLIITLGITIPSLAHKGPGTNKFLRIAGRIFLIILLLLTSIFFFVNSDTGQNYLSKQVTSHFSKELKTQIKIDHISFSLLNKMNLEGLMVEDQQKDTLLAAEKLQLRITDWFIFKDKIELKYIGLENATIKLQRSDSVWNYGFLASYFSSSSSDTTAKNSFQINLKKLALRNVVFLQKDGWRGRDMTTRFESLDLEADDIDFNRKNIAISSIEIKKPFFSIYDYTGNRPDSLKPKKIIRKEDTVSVSSLLEWNEAGLIMNIKSLKIVDGIFKNDAETDRSPYTYFDGRHFEFAKVNGEFKNLKWEKDTISSALVLSTRERSGFEVKSMTAGFKMTPHEMTFNHLSLKTNNSEIKDFFTMRYEDFDDMNDFIHKVGMQANFDNAQIASNDIAFFAPELQDWEKQIRIHGKVRGTIDDLNGRDIKIEAGSNSYLNGDITLTGLPDLNQTFIDFKANDFRTTYTDAVKFIPAIGKIDEVRLNKINYLNFNGSFTGFIRDFVTYGTIQTNIGTIKSDLNMKLPAGNEPVYSGKIATNDFQLGTLLGESSLGLISFDGDVKGRSFNINKLSADLDGKISYLFYNDYVYHNIETKGKINKKIFDGFVSINDTNARFSLNGLIDFNKNAPKFDLKADVKKLNLQQLKLTGDDLAVTGKFNLNFTGNTIDDFLGSARVTEAALFRNGNKLSFDSLILLSEYINGIKLLTVKSNEFDATLKGDFNVQDLDKTVQLFLHRYYPAYIGATRYTSNKKNFSFDLTTKNIDEYIKLVDKNLTGFNNSHVAGSVNLADNKLNLTADVPAFAYKKYSFTNSRLTGTGNMDSLVVYAVSNNITINDSLNLPSSSVKIVAHNDTSYVQISTGANQTLDKADINATVETFNNGFSLRFDTSAFVINSKKWTIEKDGTLDFRNNIVVAGEVLLRESNQEIHLVTKPSAEGQWNDLEINLKNLNMGDFSPFLLKKNRLEGLLSGKINIEDPYKRFYVTSDLEGNEVRLDNDSLGKVALNNISYNNQTGELKGRARNTDPAHQLDANVSLFLKDDSVNTKNNRIQLATKNYPIKILDRFLGSLFSDLEGYATTNLDITGDFNNLNYVGKASLHNAGLRVKFTQCFYKIDDGEIQLKSDAIDFGSLKIHDKDGRSATIQRGIIQHQSFRNLFFDIQVKTDDEPMELLNTTYNDNKSFYGQAKGTGSFFLSGPESDMIMEVYAKASDKDSATITMPSSSSRETGIADFLVEKKYGRELSDSAISSSESKMTYDVELNANPMVNIRMILDELTGDEIKARGGGTLKIHAGTRENLTLRGRYDIDEGNYLFTFQSFFKKPLVVKRGGNNYIEWNGDPLKANVRLEAQYTAENVSFGPLVTYYQLDDNIAKVRGDVFVVTTLTGQLFKPDINFKVEFPPGSEGANNPSVDFALHQLENNPNELYKQVTYLIVFNSFAPVDSRGAASTAGIALGETATNTLSGIFFNVINNEFNKILNKILKNDKYHVNISNTIYNRNFIDPNNSTALNLGNNLNVSVGRKFFNDRFILTFGGGIDAPLGQQGTVQQTVQLLPDLTAEWLINQTGTIRAIFFYRENTDYLNTTSSGTLGRTKRSGASLSYRREFNLLGGDEEKKKNKKKEVLPKPAANKQEDEPEKTKGN
ncbi:MAG: hypothetical protein JWM28_3344, partial [Chitinophagaceae bacterium]|nr:hypothetical protein [Chitinophagaceae bacterium]